MNENVLEIADIQEANEREGYGIYKKYVGIWDQPGALEILLDVVGTEEYMYKLTSPNFKKKLVWEEIASKIEARGVILGENPCRVAYQKWLNLKKNFLNVLNRKGGKTPHWFGKLNDIFEKSEGKLLGNASFQCDEDHTEVKEPARKKLKQEYLQTVVNDEIQLSTDNGQYVIEEVSQLNYSDVIAIMQQLEVERKEREEAREKREKERFDKLAELLKQQNTLTEKLITILNKQPSMMPPSENDAGTLPTCVITNEDIHD